MSYRKVLATVAICAFTILVSNSYACGDNVFRVGKGKAYRVYTAPLPGNVLVYGQSEGSIELAEALAQSGHGVRLVGSEDELASELQSGDYDVVIAPYSEHESIERETIATSNSASYLPVAMTQEEQKKAEMAYKSVMLSEKDEVKHYLKAIHKSLKAKA